MPNPRTQTRASPAESPPLVVQVDGDAASETCQLSADHPVLLVGRGAQSDLLLQKVEVSRRHALLVRWEDAVYCMDLGSRGGTRIGPDGDGHGWLVKDASAEIGPFRLTALAGPDAANHRPILHRNRLPSDRASDWRLEFVSGDIRPAAYVLHRPLTIVGRKPPCKIQLRMQTIQSVHAALLVTPDGLYVRDLSGRCAVRVDGRPMLGGWLHDGQVLELGKVYVRVAQSTRRGDTLQSEAETDDPTGAATNVAIAPLSSTAATDAGLEVSADEPSASGSEGRSVKFEDSASPSSETASSQEESYADVILGGRYKIVNKLARGGMGVVYKGLDVRLHRVVAIKVVRCGGNAAAHRRRRLLREAMVCSRFDHPAIARVLDVDKRGRFAVFEYVSGETLADRLRRDDRIAPAQAARWMAQVADAIDHLGRHRVVHRDIKPANVLIADDGTAKLVDFGLSHIADAGDSETLAMLTEQTERPRPGIAIGTAPFASPEQFEDSQAVDARSDIYSAGCTLFTLLAGKTPFGGSVTETFRQHRDDPVPRIPGLSADVMAVVDKCLAKAPSDRYQSGAELAAALRAVVE